MKLKHIFIFKCQELTVKCFKCTVREWKSRSEIKWKWIKRSAEWKHFKTWHQNCPWVIAVIRACVWVQEEEHPVWEHCSYTSKLNQAWIIQTFSPISLSLSVRPSSVPPAVRGRGTYLQAEVGRGRSGAINGCRRWIWAAAAGWGRKRVMKMMKGCSEHPECQGMENRCRWKHLICFKRAHIWCTEVKQRRTGEKRRRQELNERIIFQKDTKRTRTKKWGRGSRTDSESVH